MKLRKLVSSLVIAGVIAPGIAGATNGYFTHGYGMKSKGRAGVTTAYTIGYNDWRIVVVGDFNRDGSMDILWSNPITGAVYVWFMNGSNFTGEQHIRTIGFTDWRIVGVGDFNRDGDPDILWRHQGTGQINVWHMRGAGFISDFYIATIQDSNWKIVGPK